MRANVRAAGPSRHPLRAAVLGLRATLGRAVPRRPYNVLTIELAGALADGESEPLHLTLLGRHRGVPDLLTLLAVLRSAREDRDLGLVLLDLHGLAGGWGQLQTVRRALRALRAAGKRVWAFLPDPGMREYYVATAADRILLAPGARFDVTGIATEVVFFKEALDKLGIEAQLARVGQFKSAAEPFTRADMSAEHRAMIDALLDDLYGQLVRDIAEARALEPGAVRAALEEGPLLAAEAERRGLVDALAYPQDIDDALAERFGNPAPITFGAYRRRRRLAMRRAALDATAVGLLTIEGAIGLGEAVPAAVGRRPGGWRAFRRDLGALARDPRVAGIVVRINSPGGSGLASDLMWREVVDARQWKPVLVSMGDVAASGGYFVAAGADHVTAEPGTLTGSIGVLAGKPVLRGLYAHLGLRKELVTRGNAGLHSDYVRLDDTELARLQREADALYGDFVSKVATGRGLDRAAVEQVAQGRVWTGRQAHAHGLVDRLGGIEECLDELRRRLDLPADAGLAVARPGRRRTLWNAILEWRATGEAALERQWGQVGALVAAERVVALMPVVLRFLGRGQDDALAALSPARSSLAVGRLRELLRPTPLVW